MVEFIVRLCLHKYSFSFFICKYTSNANVVDNECESFVPQVAKAFFFFLREKKGYFLFLLFSPIYFRHK